MTDAPTIVRAAYATWRAVQTRKVLQLVFEVPIEQTELAMKALGVPNSEATTWCAIARLDVPQNAGGAQRSASILSGPDTSAMKVAVTTAPDTSYPDAVPQGQGKERHLQDVAGDTPVPVRKARAFKDLPRSQQAAIKCLDVYFVTWLTDEFYAKTPHAQVPYDPDGLLKAHLEIASKKELDSDPFKAAAWDALKTDFELRAYAR